MFSIKNKDGHKIVSILGVKFKFRRTPPNYNILLCEIAELKKQIKKTLPQKQLNILAMDLNAHCNLRCQSCDHFSPLAKEEYYDINQFERDIKRSSELFGNNGIQRFVLEGGECLLNKNLFEYIRILRQYFPSTCANITTNGILLPAQKKEFWQNLKKYNIGIYYTRYPININYEKIENMAKEYSVNLFCANPHEKVKTSYKPPLDLEGKQDERESFLNCYHANNTVALKNGKIYPCTIAPYIDRFNNYFNKNLELTEKDGIDIFRAETADEILEFLARPIPFCRYCRTKERTSGHKWVISKKSIEEWT